MKQARIRTGIRGRGAGFGLGLGGLEVRKSSSVRGTTLARRLFWGSFWQPNGSLPLGVWLSAALTRQPRRRWLLFGGYDSASTEVRAPALSRALP